MIAVAQAPVALLFAFLLSLAAAAYFDVWKRTVPNLAVIAVAISGIAAFVSIGRTDTIWQPLAVAVAVIVIGVPLFARQWVGGGDIKLLASTACWFTAKGALQMLVAVALAGGILAATSLALKFAQRRSGPARSATGVPYAVAIATGAAFQVWRYRY